MPKPKTRRNKPCRIHVGDKQPHEVTAGDFRRAIASGWIVSTAHREARIADNVRAVLRDGVLWLENAITRAITWIYTSWVAIDRKAPPRGEHYQRELKLQYGPQSRKVEPEGTWIERCDWSALKSV